MNNLEKNFVKDYPKNYDNNNFFPNKMKRTKLKEMLKKGLL